MRKRALKASDKKRDKTRYSQVVRLIPIGYWVLALLSFLLELTKFLWEVKKATP